MPNSVNENSINMRYVLMSPLVDTEFYRSQKNLKLLRLNMIKFIVVLLLATLACAQAQSPCVGCSNQLSLQKAETLVNNSLKKLSTGEGPFYKLAKINSATSQVVQGSLYKINADLIDANNKSITCDIEIIDFQGITITFSCPGQQKLTRKHSA